MEEQSPLVSIILPVWNGKKTLACTVESVQRQSCTHWELILVDDGSTDGSGQLADEMARQDQRIRVIHQKNGGVSRARNRGLQEAKGKYVRFVDADDRLPPDSLLHMVTYGEETGCDLVIGAFRRVERNRTRTVSFFSQKTALQKDAYLQHLCTRSNSFYYGVIWNKLFRLDLIRRGEVSFLPDLHWGEDFAFVMVYMKQVEVIGYLGQPVYDYVVNAKGLTMHQALDSVIHPFANIGLKIHHYRHLKALYQHHGLYPPARRQLWRYLFRTTIYR